VALKKYRAGIIGLGRIGFTLGFDKKREKPSSHSGAFGSNRRISLEGGFDTDPLKRSAWGKYYRKASVYSSLAEMLSDGSWDILVIAVPEENHLSVFEKAAPFKPGLIVLEKPVAPEIKDAYKIKRTARKYGVPVLVNHERRFSRDYILLKKLIFENKLGEPVNIDCSLYTPSRAIKALVRDGTHLFDAAAYLIGTRPVIRHAEAYGAGLSCMGRTGGVNAFFNIGYRTGHFTFEIDIIFKNGRARIGNGLFEVSASKESPYYEGFCSLVKVSGYGPFRKTGYFSGMAANCVDFLDGKAAIGSTLEDGIGSLLTIEEIKTILKGKAPERHDS
jgi:predicted dehydrogenase